MVRMRLKELCAQRVEIFVGVLTLPKSVKELGKCSIILLAHDTLELEHGENVLPQVRRKSGIVIRGVLEYPLASHP